MSVWCTVCTARPGGDQEPDPVSANLRSGERECLFPPTHRDVCTRCEPRLAFAGTGMPRLARLPSVQLDEPRNPQVYHGSERSGAAKRNPDLDFGLPLC